MIQLAIRQSTIRLLKLVLGCFVGSAFMAWALDSWGINLFGFPVEDVARNAYCLGFFAIAACLFLPSLRKERPALLVLVPALSQYYQVVLAWDYPAGALSPYRLLPFLACSVAVLSSLPMRAYRLTKLEGLAWLAIAGVGLIGWLANGDRTGIGVMGFLLLSVFLPLILLAIRCDIRLGGEQARGSLYAGCLAAFLTYCLGNLAVIQFASGLNLGGVGGLLGTRNASDFNLILAYLSLLWPLAMKGADAFGPGAVAFVSVLFVATCVLGLSRVGIAAGPLLVIVSLVGLYGKKPKQLGLALSALVGIGVLAWMALPNKDTLGQVWVARFNVSDLSNVEQILNRVQPGGEDSQNRDLLRIEALRLAKSDLIHGQGFGGFNDSSAVGFNDAHSLTFTVLAEHGLVGLSALYIGLGVILLKLIRRITLGSKCAPVSGSMLVAFVVWLFVVHSVGGNLLMLAESGFSVNAMNAILLGLYSMTCVSCRPTTSESP